MWAGGVVRVVGAGVAERSAQGVLEISRRTGIFSGKGDTGKGEASSMTRSIAWGIVLKLYRAGRTQKCPKSPGRSGYEPTELAAVRMRSGVGGG